MLAINTEASILVRGGWLGPNEATKTTDTGILMTAIVPTEGTTSIMSVNLADVPNQTPPTLITF